MKVKVFHDKMNTSLVYFDIKFIGRGLGNQWGEAISKDTNLYSLFIRLITSNTIVAIAIRPTKSEKLQT